MQFNSINFTYNVNISLCKVKSPTYSIDSVTRIFQAGIFLLAVNFNFWKVKLEIMRKSL